MNRTALAVFLTLTLPSAVIAGPGDRHELRKDRGALKDDLRDEQLATALLQDFDRAAAMRNNRTLAAVEERVAVALRDELAEASRETGEAAREARRSEHEVRHEEREVASDARRGDRREFRDDRRDLQDERGDAAKDRHDLMEKSEYRQRIQGLNDEWTRIRPLRGPRWMQRKHDMLVELVELSRREIRSDRGEVREDRGERREDREERHAEHRERGW